MTSNPPATLSGPPKLGASFLYDNSAWDSDDSEEDSDDDGDNKGDDDYLPSEPPSDWEFDDESRPMTPDDQADDWAFLEELYSKPSTATTPSRKRQASEPSPSAAPSSTRASLQEHPLKQSRSKSTWAKEREKGGEGWPPKMLSE
jgi:hypothetical protein